MNSGDQLDESILEKWRPEVDREAEQRHRAWAPACGQRTGGAAGFVWRLGVGWAFARAIRQLNPCILEEARKEAL